MKKLMYFTAGLVAITAGSVALGETPIDFKAVNPVIQSLVDAVIVADDTVDYALPKFDEKVSNLRENRIKYDTWGRIKNTPWLEGGRTKLTASATFEVDATTSHPSTSPWGEKVDAHFIFTHMQARIETDTMAFLRHWADVGLKKITNFDPRYEERVKAHLKRLSVATSLDEFYNLFYSFRHIGQDALTDELKRHEKAIACIENLVCFKEKYAAGKPESELDSYRQWWLKNEQEARDYQQNLLRAYPLVQLEPIKSGGRVQAIKLIVDQKVVDALPKPEHKPTNARPIYFELKITDETITTMLDVWGNLEVKDYARLKSDMQTILGELQEGNVERKKKTEDAFRKALVTFKKGMRGEFQQ